MYSSTTDNSKPQTLGRRALLKWLTGTSAAIALGVIGAIAIPDARASRFIRPIRYRAPRLPRRPPRVWSPVRAGAGKTATTAMQASVARAQAALTVTSGTARTQLRNALSTSGKSLKHGRSWNAHHVLNWEFRKHPTLAKAAKGGFNINGVENGLRIPQRSHKLVHSQVNNSANRQAVTKLLDDLKVRRPHYTPAQTATVVRNHVRLWKYDVIKTDPLLTQFNREVML